MVSSLPSAQFRKSFPRLTELVRVTSHGHLLGTWVPGGDLLAEVKHLRAELEIREEQLAAFRTSVDVTQTRVTPGRDV
jgi:hypothetical protein